MNTSTPCPPESLTIYVGYTESHPSGGDSFFNEFCFVSVDKKLITKEIKNKFRQGENIYWHCPKNDGDKKTRVPHRYFGKLTIESFECKYKNNFYINAYDINCHMGSEFAVRVLSEKDDEVYDEFGDDIEGNRFLCEWKINTMELQEKGVIFYEEE